MARPLVEIADNLDAIEQVLKASSHGVMQGVAKIAGVVLLQQSAAKNQSFKAAAKAPVLTVRQTARRWRSLVGLG